MRRKNRHIRAAAKVAKVAAERMVMAFPAEFTITAAASPLAGSGADLLTAISDCMSSNIEAAGVCDSVARSIENDWFYVRSFDVAAAAMVRAAEKMNLCIAASKKFDAAGGTADAAIVKGCRDLSDQCKQLAARCIACKSLCETTSKDDAQEKDIKEACAKTAITCNSTSAVAKACGAECESMATVSAGITAEAPMGNQAGIDTPAVGNSADPNNGKSAGGSPGKPPLPKFSLTFYNGGAMHVTGWKLPVVVKCSGVKCASGRLPIYANHIDGDTSGSEMIDQLIGQTSGPCTVVQGSSLVCSGEITGKSKTVQSFRDHVDGGFQWQASMDAMPTKGHVIREGESEEVNGKMLAGPAYVADESVLANVAVVPLGADTTTFAHFAATNAARRSDMEFEAWLKAEYDMTPAEYAALEKDKPGQHGKIKARWEKVGNIAAGNTTGSDATIRTPAAAGGSVRAGGSAAGGSAAEDLKDFRASRAAESRRIAKLDQIQAQYSKVELLIDGKTIKCADYIASAIEDGTEPDTVELELLRASRKATSSGTAPAGGAPFINTGRGARKVGVLGEYHGAPSSRNGRNELPPTVTSFNDDLCRVVEAAALISAGHTKNNHQWSEVLTKHPQYGERCVQAASDELHRFGHGLGPMGLICMAASMAGMTNLPRNNADAYEEIRNVRGEFTTFTLPAILSNVMNKFLLDGYYSVDPNAGAGGGIAWQQFTRRGSVNDFKPNYRARLIGNFKPKNLGEAGEIQSMAIGDQSYSIQAKVKALMGGIPYNAIVNDDLNAFSTLPTQAGVGCGEQVAEDVYTALLAGNQSDNATAFFSATDRLAASDIRKLNAFAHNSITGAGSALSVAGLTAAFQQFLLQVKPNGAPLGELPAILLAPVGLAVTANQLYQDSQLIPALATTTGTASSTFGTNPHKGLYRPVVSQYLSNALLSGYSTTAWYLTTAPTSSVYTIEAAFLNGSEMPIVERDEMSFDRLGIGFRWWLSYGVAMGAPRAAQKNAGV